MRSLKVILPDNSRIWIGECPAEYLVVFGEAMSELFALQSTHGDPMLAFNDPAVRSLIRFVASFLPILPFRREVFCVDSFLDPLDIPNLSTYFYGVDCRIAQLHAPPETSTPPLTQDEYTVENMPIQGSGNATADLLSRLSLIDNSTANAMQLIRTYDMGTLNALIQQVGELKRDPRERFEEYKAKRLDATIKDAKENDFARYAELIGLGPDPEDNLPPENDDNPD